MGDDVREALEHVPKSSTKLTRNLEDLAKRLDIHGPPGTGKKTPGGTKKKKKKKKSKTRA
jgi:hypothetical protein